MRCFYCKDAGERGATPSLLIYTWTVGLILCTESVWEYSLRSSRIDFYLCNTRIKLYQIIIHASASNSINCPQFHQPSRLDLYLKSSYKKTLTPRHFCRGATETLPLTFCLCSKVFGVDDGDVRGLLASDHITVATNTLRGSSILTCNLSLYCGGTAWVVLTLPKPHGHCRRKFLKGSGSMPIDGVCSLHATWQISTFLGSGASVDQANFSSFIKPSFPGPPQQARHEQQPAKTLGEPLWLF